MDKSNKTEVMVLGTLHGFHKINKLYSFDDVFSIVENFKPDVIGVEIREEDMSQPREYLNKAYPYEMIEAKFKYADKCKLYGFDWLWEDIEGKLIPEKYFETLEVKILEKEFETSQEFKRIKALLDVIDNYRLEVFSNCKAQDCNNDKYDLISEIYYSQLESGLKDTRFEPMCKAYASRDSHIDNNMIKIINENKGKRIIFLTGLDHRHNALKSIKQYFNDEVVIK